MSRRVSFSVLLFAIGSSSLVCAADVDFERDVWPILEARCIECHRGAHHDKNGRMKRPKAGLRFDGKSFILAGSEDSDEIVVPGKPDQSEILSMISLPADDPDIMPPKGDPLRPREIAMIRRWIAGGAEFGKWVGVDKAQPAASDGKSKTGDEPKAAVERVPHRIATFEQIGRGVAPLPKAELDRASAAAARVEPVFPGSPLLRVAFVSNETDIVDKTLAKLAPITTHIAILDLGRTKVGDAGMVEVAKMSRLVRLDLSETDVGDPGLKHIAALPELRSLVLRGTKVSDAGLESLAGLAKLESLYVWQTSVTAAAIDGFRTKRPTVAIRAQLKLPDPAPTPANGRRRRRG